MKPYALLVGTSKSKPEEGWYLSRTTYKHKLWDPLKEVFDVEYDPNHFQNFTKQTGVGFHELIPPEYHIEGNDNKLFAKYFENQENLDFLNQALKDFKKYLQDHNIKFVGFNGKQAAGLFFLFLQKGEYLQRSEVIERVPVNQGRLNFNNLFGTVYDKLPKCPLSNDNNYGKIETEFLPEVQFYGLFNMGGGQVATHWNEDKLNDWKKFWQIVKKNNPKNINHGKSKS